MEYGDVVKMLVVIGGKEKEIMKDIAMELVGSKCSQKVIPIGWRVVKVTTMTSSSST